MDNDSIGRLLTTVVLLFTTVVITMWTVPQTWNAIRHWREDGNLVQQYRVREALGALGWLFIIALTTWMWIRVLVSGPIQRRPLGEQWEGTLIATIVVLIFAVWYLIIYRAIKRRSKGQRDKEVRDAAEE